MIVGLLAAAVWFAVKATRLLLRHRAFGSAVLELDPPGHLRLGGALTRSRLKHPEFILLDSEFNILHLAIVIF